MATTKTNQRARAEKAAPVSTLRADATRGEVTKVINGKSALFVPSFDNIERFESATDLGVIDVIQGFGKKNKLSTIVNMLHCFNEGDDLSRNEIYSWLSYNGSDVAEVLTALTMGIIDPDGKRFDTNSDDEGDAGNA